jgi:DNA polymerase-3 subunit beta
LETALKATVSQQNLQKGLGIVARAVSPRSTLPVLSNVLLRAEAGGLTLAGTNLELGITARVEATVEQDGAITVPSRLLSDLVGTLPNEPVALSVNPNTCTLTVKCGASSTEIKGIDAGEFPPMPARLETSTAVYRSDTLKAMFERVTFAASTDEARPVLQGVQVTRLGERVTMSATDGFRVSVVAGEDYGPVEKAQTAIIPAKALGVVAAMLDTKHPEDVLFTITGAQAIYQGGTWMVVTQTIDGNFPPFEQIIPRKFRARAVAPTAALLLAIRQAEMIAKSGNNVVKLGFRPDDALMGALDITSASEETGGYEGGVALAEMDGPTLDIAFNAAYLREALERARAEQVVIQSNDGKSPVRITAAGDDNWQCIIMPCHVG